MSQRIELDVEWRDRAYCAGQPVSWFFPVFEVDWPEARARCKPCPVKTECAVFAIVSRSNDGCWGGMDHKERKAWARSPRGRQVLREWGERMKPERGGVF